MSVVAVTALQQGATLRARLLRLCACESPGEPQPVPCLHPTSRDPAFTGLACGLGWLKDPQVIAMCTQVQGRLLKGPAAQSTALWTRRVGHPRAAKTCRVSGPTPDLLTQSRHFNKTPGIISKLEKNSLKALSPLPPRCK